MDGVAADPPCHPQACAIQGKLGLVKREKSMGIQANLSIEACLTSNSYNEAKCRNQIIQLYKCCNALYTQKGENAKTPSCPKPALLKVKLKQIENGDI
ncbi:Cx9C motif-containing protein 4, mitochondrial [Microsporum canis]|uniref:Cx9C motif-containing protein 4, mitochondrial n=1 Tax=Arthroderma otae (strain ATCC MYA-4605 / CBS 113480) TaxID=554155 RepID=C5FHL2_ARTOC|nr:uncharacterized protein MCYG_01571 [Microsporum canis CBS 113480]EEQ28752.1 predicted protein [Microsporum canis CBS 113480]